MSHPGYRHGVKTLYLLRHAKSDWNDDDLDDHDRPLAPRGERACDRIGAFLAAAPAPEIALCSTARRAVDTLGRIASHLSRAPVVRLDRRLYLATPDEMLERLSWLEPDFGRALVVGHNPGVHQLAADLAGRGDAAALARLSRKFPTAALAILGFPAGSWAELAPGRGELIDFVTPKRLRE